MDDLISRKEAIETIRSMTVSISGKDILTDEAKKSVIEAIDVMAGVQVENRWKRVEEEPPEGEVIAANFKPGTYGYQECLIGYIGKKDGGFIAENDYEILTDVTHWMPIPEQP